MPAEDVARVVSPPEGAYESPLSRGAFVAAGPDRALDVPAGGCAILLDGLLGATAPFGFLLAGATPVSENPAVASRLFVYSPSVDGAPGVRSLSLLPTHRLSGNAFEPLSETGTLAAALLRVEPGRGVTTGFEAERTFVILTGTGLAFLESGDAIPFRAGEALVVPAGEPVRLWARDPDPLFAVALQPQAPPAERRTLLGELRKLKEKSRP
jgi:mannose-6-phosphate isomerase-like protein (cupin superfamily)